LEINKEWMFRFPRSPVAAEAMRNEVGFLPQFGPLSPLPVPVYVYRHACCVGYKKIWGENLRPDKMRQLPDNKLDDLAARFAAFLSTIHTFPTDQAEALGLRESWGDWRRKGRAYFMENLSPLLTRRARLSVESLFDEFFNMEFQKVVVHGDFNSDHILFDNATSAITGIIDFGDLTIEDPATDLHGVYDEFGHSFFEKLLSHYTGPIGDALFDRMKTRTKATVLFDAVYAHQRGREDRLNRNLMTIENNYESSETQPIKNGPTSLCSGSRGRARCPS